MRLVRQLREELGTDHGTVQRVANQLGYGVKCEHRRANEILKRASAFFAAELDRPQK